MNSNISPSRIASDTTPAAVYVIYLNMVFFGSNKPDAVSTLSETRSSYRNEKKKEINVETTQWFGGTLWEKKDREEAWNKW